MSTLALALWGVYVAVAVGLRVLVQWKMWKQSGFVLSRNRVGSLEWMASRLVTFALLSNIAASIVPLFAPDAAGWRVWATPPELTLAGLLAYAFGLAITFVAQLQMGAHWRVGLDPEERTGLVAHGLFRLVRNPIYTGMLATSAGLTAVSPSAVALGGCLLLLAALQLQVRGLEEPYLSRLHGEAYRTYAARTGRFVPCIGRSAGSQ